MMEGQKYAIVDIETTGHAPANGDRIIQMAIVIMRDWTIEKTYTKFLHPGKSIPAYIQDLTNITDADVADAPSFELYADYIYELLQDAVFVAHNTDFDLPFLQFEFRRAGLPKWHGKKMDTVELAKILFPTSLSYKLGDLAADLAIPLATAHRADEDAMATAFLFKRCWEELLNLPQTTLEQLHKRSFRLKSNLSQLFFDALSVRRMRVTDTEVHVYFNKIAIRKMAPMPKTVQKEQGYPTTRQEKTTLLKQGLPNYEERPEQFVMMDHIWTTLQQQSEKVIEASTGIGKTLGYLLPACLYAKQTGRKVGISTYTGHLLDQLLQNELPKMEAVLGEPIKVALLKGMNHYVDVVRFEQMLKAPDESYDETFTLLQVLIWLTKTETGDLNELNVSGGGQRLLDRIRKIELPKTTMPLYDFYSRALQNSRHADLIVTNHAMLLADLVRHAQIFEHIGGWVIDEAHQFVQAAIQRDEQVFAYTQWKYLFGQIGLYTDEQLFYQFQRIALKKQRVPMQTLQQLEKRFMQLIHAFDEAMAMLQKEIGRNLQTMNRHEMKPMLFMQDLQLDWARFGRVASRLQAWLDLADEVGQQFASGVDELAPEHQYVLTQWHYLVREFKLKASEWDELFLADKAHYSAWLEIDRRSMPGSIKLFKKPINVTTVIEQLFEPIRARAGIVWTSGTLTVPSNTHFITDQLGVSREVEVVSLQAPASYYEGAQAFIVSDMPDIQAVSQEAYIEEVAHAITRTVQMTEGRSFVLFTSQDMLRKTVELIQESGLLKDYMLFAQGVTAGSRMRLLKAFQKFNRSVLFGTNSFWEGVDVPGDGLASVIVVRLPFAAPEEPTFKARAHFIQSQGGDAFADLALPEAILRFKQGFGRLVRASGDRGVLIVLDRRIESKSYGVEFIRALPPISVQKLALEAMVQALRNWYNEKR